jgi:hypothetical protein
VIERYIKRISKQTAVYWSSPSPAADGANRFAAPTEIKCFWVNETELTVEKHGKEVSVVATVYVSQDLDEQGMLYLGTLSELTTAQKADPRYVSRAYEITRFRKDPSLHKSGEFSRRAFITPRSSKQI